MRIVITGGSRGIGAAAVRLFAAQGHQVFFLYHTNDQAAARLATETGATALQADVADGAAVRAALALAGDVDVLICNAGLSHMGLISQITEDQWDRLFAVNVKGIYHCVNAALPSMLAQQRGCVITVSSMWGQVGASCEAAYSATKGAVIALTKSLAKELGPSGIRVNCICPGAVETDMLGSLSQDTLDMLREETPLGRLGSPEDVAQAMDYLVQASFVTGQILPINGGFLI